MCTKAWNLYSKPWNIKFLRKKKLFSFARETFFLRALQKLLVMTSGTWNASTFQKLVR